MSLSIILPTINRPTLRAAIESVVPQLKLADELIVIGHGVLPKVAYAVSQYPKTRYFEDYTDSPYGADRRNVGMDYAYGSHFVFLDDDDILLPNALTIIRAQIRQQPEHLLFFRITQGVHGISNWYIDKFIPHNIACANIVVPNTAITPRWTTPHDDTEDWVFIKTCAEVFPYSFIDEVTHHYRPDTNS